MPRKKDNKMESDQDNLFYPDHGRKLVRKSVLWPAYIHFKDHRLSCQIRNLSVGGLRIKLDIPFKDGVAGVVEIPRYNLMLKAEVAWQSDGFFGLKFLDDHDVIREQFNEGAAIVGVDAIRLMGALG